MCVGKGWVTMVGLETEIRFTLTTIRLAKSLIRSAGMFVLVISLQTVPLVLVILSFQTVPLVLVISLQLVPLVLVISLQIVPLQSIMHELDDRVLYTRQRPCL